MSFLLMSLENIRDPGFKNLQLIINYCHQLSICPVPDMVVWFRVSEMRLDSVLEELTSSNKSRSNLEAAGRQLLVQNKNSLG